MSNKGPKAQESLSWSSGQLNDLHHRILEVIEPEATGTNGTSGGILRHPQKISNEQSQQLISAKIKAGNNILVSSIPGIQTYKYSLTLKYIQWMLYKLTGKIKSQGSFVFSNQTQQYYSMGCMLVKAGRDLSLNISSQEKSRMFANYCKSQHIGEAVLMDQRDFLIERMAHNKKLLEWCSHLCDQCIGKNMRSAGYIPANFTACNDCRTTGLRENSSRSMQCPDCKQRNSCIHIQLCEKCSGIGIKPK